MNDVTISVHTPDRNASYARIGESAAGQKVRMMTNEMPELQKNTTIYEKREVRNDGKRSYASPMYELWYDHYST